MKISEVTKLCDAIELGCLQLNKQLTRDDVFKELSLGYYDEHLKEKIDDAFALAQKRWSISASAYPYQVTERTIESNIDSVDINSYLFLLLGNHLKYSNRTQEKNTLKLFRRYFEDLVSWSLTHSGLKSSILSIPREERGLPGSLKDALKEIAKLTGEQATLIESKISSSDKDIGVDIVAVNLTADDKRSGKPVFLIQCATGSLSDLSDKIGENFKIFPEVWDRGFYKNSSLSCVATPDDLINLSELEWDRLCKLGWILDRLRLTRLFELKTGVPPNYEEISDLWYKLLEYIEQIDWRTVWRD